MSTVAETGNVLQNKPTKEQSSLPKRRILRACDQCHTRKVKCNAIVGQGTPCAECARNDLNCTFETAPKKRGRKSCRVDSIKQQENQKRIRMSETPKSPISTSDILIPSEISPPSEFIYALRSPVSSSGPSRSPILGGDGGGGGQVFRAPSSPYGSITTRPSLSLPPINGNKAVSPLVYRHSPTSAILVPANGVNAPSPATSSSADGRIATTRAEKETIDRPLEEIKVPPIKVIEYFAIQLFFACVYPIFPLVHEGTIRTSWEDGQFEKDERFSALIFSMCAISASQASSTAILESGHFTSAIKAGETFVQLSLNKRGRVITAEDVMDVQTTYFLGQWAANAGKEDLSWHYLGEAIRLGLGLGLHIRREEEYKDLVDREVSRRLLWQLFVCDKNDALIADRPMVLRSDEVTIPFPLDVDDEYITPTLIHPQPPNKVSLLTGFNASNRLWQIFEELILGFRADRRQLFALGQPMVVPVHELTQNMYKGLNKVATALDGLPTALIIPDKAVRFFDLDPRLQIQRANLHVTRETMSLVFYTHYSSLIGNQDDPYIKNATIIFKGQTASRLLKVFKTLEKDDLKNNGGHLVMKIRIVIAGLLEVIQLAPDPTVVAQASRDLADYLEIMASIAIPSEDDRNRNAQQQQQEKLTSTTSSIKPFQTDPSIQLTPPPDTQQQIASHAFSNLIGTGTGDDAKGLDFLPLPFSETWNGLPAFSTSHTTGVDWSQPFWTTVMGNINF